MKMIMKTHMFRAESATTKRRSDGTGRYRSCKRDIFEEFSGSTIMRFHWRNGFSGEYITKSLNRIYVNRYLSDVWSYCSIKGEMDIL
ncbi:MAG TPA: hypothetical protein VMX17_10725 [Candidatus Glassbacteria bacterium]|nr:hypothetical protein [Candidatus Glassbacteria bacterium]